MFRKILFTERYGFPLWHVLLFGEWRLVGLLDYYLCSLNGKNIGLTFLVSTTLKKCHKNSKWSLGTPIKVFSGELNEEVQLFFSLFRLWEPTFFPLTLLNIWCFLISSSPKSTTSRRMENLGTYLYYCPAFVAHADFLAVLQ